MIVFDVGLPTGPITVNVERGMVVEVLERALPGARPARGDEVRAFWDHFWRTGVFPYAFDFSSLTPFQEKAVRLVHTVPVGETVTYGELAHLMGHPRAFRAVGSAMAKNPFPILYPCHRVVLNGRRVGAYGFGGTGAKERLLRWEEGLCGHL